MPASAEAAASTRSFEKPADPVWESVLREVEHLQGRVVHRNDDLHVMTFFFDTAAYLSVQRFRNLAAFAGRLRRRGDPLSAQIHDALSAELRDRLEAYDPIRTPKPALAGQLVDELNRVLHRESLDLSDLEFDEATHEQLARSSDLVRRNAIVFQHVYRDHVYPSPLLSKQPVRARLYCTVHLRRITDGGGSRIRFTSWLEAQPSLDGMDRFLLERVSP